MSETIYSFNAPNLQGENLDLSDFKGQVVLIVNTASKCGLTPQFEGLQSLYDEFKDQGFTMFGFPCNQFANQEPGDAQTIGGFCQRNYGVSFPMFGKIDVNGANEHPLYTHLKNKKKGVLGTKAIKWNFTKFLVDRDGKVVARFAPKTEPADIASEIRRLL